MGERDILSLDARQTWRQAHRRRAYEHEHRVIAGCRPGAGEALARRAHGFEGPRAVATANMLRGPTTLCRRATRLAVVRSQSRWCSTRLGNFGPQEFIQTQKDLFPDHVLEEEKTGTPGLPLIRDEELWKPGNEEMLMAERAEWWWDDGTAEPEWFVDRGSSGGVNGGRPWVTPTNEAAATLVGVLLSIGVFVGGGAYLLGDALRPAARRHEHGFPQDMRAQFGLPTEAGAEDDE